MHWAIGALAPEQLLSGVSLSARQPHTTLFTSGKDIFATDRYLALNSITEALE